MAPRSRSTSPGATTRPEAWWSRGRRPAGRYGPGCGSASGSSRPRSASTPTGSTARPCGPTTRACTGCAPAPPTATRSPRTTTGTRADPFSATFTHRARRPGRVPVHQLRRPRHAEHRLGPVLRPGRVRGRRGGVVPAAVPPAQRRPLLRRPEPGRAAAGVAGLRQQQPGLGRVPAVDAGAGQPRDRVRQRAAGVHLLPDQVHAAAQRGRRTSRDGGTPFASARCCSSR